MDKCRLCKKIGKLCKAHIVPNMFIRFIRENTGNEIPIQVDRNDQFAKNRPIGWYDNSILCEKCDQSLGIYDEYAGKILLDDRKLIAHSSGMGYAVKDIDSSKLIKFFVSLLWRAGICKLNEFANVSLGPYENKLRQVLLFDKYKADYLSVILSRMEGKKFDDGAKYSMSVPFRQTGETNYWIWYLPNGYKVLIRLDKRPLEDGFINLEIGRTDDLLILRNQNFDNSREFQNMIELIRNK
jgi:hypothetical protein